MVEPVSFATTFGTWSQHVPRLFFRTVHGGASHHFGRQLLVLGAEQASHEPLRFACVSAQLRQPRTSATCRQRLPRRSAHDAPSHPLARAFCARHVLRMRQVQQHATKQLVWQVRNARFHVHVARPRPLSMPFDFQSEWSIPITTSDMWHGANHPCTACHAQPSTTPIEAANARARASIRDDTPFQAHQCERVATHERREGNYAHRRKKKRRAGANTHEERERDRDGVWKITWPEPIEGKRIKKRKPLCTQGGSDGLKEERWA